jgi:hypothetical protein
MSDVEWLGWHTRVLTNDAIDTNALKIWHDGRRIMTDVYDRYSIAHMVLTD